MAAHRTGIRLDMTPMVDIAFLLLTFFMLTTQFRPPAEVDVVLPDSHSQIKLPESDVLTITIAKDGDLYLGVDSQFLRRRLFGEEYMLKTEVPIEMKSLAHKLVEARVANPKLRAVLKSDRDTEYGVVMAVMDIMQKVNLTRFNLVTNLERNNE
ncbi:MAG: biopolymer transporter ExbD [candidate division KSB1 bacterium]|nr:biopolymer transporter ExbD [candidate division KSB1 bacterium]MDZ7274203.1 biopolymer transporter ExbD [candidate division KSB1 bacterium]MDZ7287275.1 biopolymer transporter ExbD [candidate division KSB1 bacterium]MDZ7296801.1 biopolymer transporter ExbD [candidate division KSB1 bacterium]MDZ7308446.1 biopolymer transporter ExbD [candidate division KSB1 bacterium]